MITNQTLARLYHSNCEAVGVEFCTDTDVLAKPTGSTDMGNVSHILPAIHPHFYIAAQAAPHTPLFADAAGNTSTSTY